mmetsp:Transcript_61361/g.138909  ORF Transcript_61361/g.138909 Transcript_61361/m.138909 type:complete len:106 (-) Transcript_61361:1060-1377(-)
MTDMQLMLCLKKLKKSWNSTTRVITKDKRWIVLAITKEPLSSRIIGMLAYFKRRGGSWIWRKRKAPSPESRLRGDKRQVSNYKIRNITRKTRHRLVRTCSIDLEL